MINTFLDPAQLPSRTQEQKIFDIFMGQFMQNLPTFAQQVNDTAGQINSAVAGGAYALPYVFDSSTVDADPGAGKLRLSSTTQNAATVMRLDVLAGGQDVSSLLDQFDASTSDVKGSIRLLKVGDPSKWLTFNVMARTAPSGYRNLTVVNTGGSSASPFASGEGVLLFFQRNGDIGLGLSATALLASVSITSAVASADFLNIFTSQFDRYQIEMTGIRPTAASNLGFRLASGGAPLTTGYYGPTGSGTSAAALNQVNIGMGFNSFSTSGGGSFTVEVRNANSTSHKSFSLRGSYRETSTNYYNSVFGECFHAGGQVLSGFQIFFDVASGINIATGGKIQVYGFKNS